jgi:AcrR family transcriptional regulator
MTRGTPATPGTVQTRRARGSLSHEEIINGAFEFAVEETIDGLSMPRLAKHLGVGVTSIYWYFSSKDEFLDALSVEAAHRFAQRIPELSGYAWDEHVRHYFRAHRQILREDRVLCDLIVLRTPAGYPRTMAEYLGILDRELGVLMDAGFSPEAAMRAYMTLSVYTRGCVLNERLFELAGLGDQDLRLPPVLPGLIGTEYPAMAKASEFWSRTFATDDDFEAGLSSIIDGFRARLAAQRAGSPRPVPLPAPQSEVTSGSISSIRRSEPR